MGNRVQLKHQWVGKGADLGSRFQCERNDASRADHVSMVCPKSLMI
jgi:hypothetical protein